MKKYYHGLDGLRALAIMSVIFYHLLPNVFKGGFLGVPLFFGISGFLIVSPLINEKLETNQLDFRTFYLKRLKRIYPSLLIMIVFVGVVAFSIKGDRNYVNEATSGLLGVNNYWQLMNQVSYFNQSVDVRLLKHLWSLSVELQFYLIIPVFIDWLIIGKRYTMSRLKEAFVIISLISWLIMMLVFLFKGNSVAYYLFTTRLFSFSLGMLASYYCFYEKKKLPEKVGIISLVLMIILVFTVKDYQASTYMAWIFIYSCLVSLSIWSVVTNDTLNKFLSWSVFKFIGVRSYDIFLWYYPVITLYQTYFKWDGSAPVFHITVQCLIIFLLSDFSYHLSQIITGKRSKPALFRVLITLEIISLLSISVGVYQAVEVKEANQTVTSTTRSSSSLEKESSASKTSDTTAETTESSTNVKKDIPPITEDVLFIGDSVMLGTEHYIYDAFTGTNTFVKAKVGKQPYEILDDFKEVNISPYRIVVIGLGNNGLMERSDFDQVMTYLKSKQVILVNTAVNRPWKAANNNLINSYVADYDNVSLVDWDKQIVDADTSEYLVEDGIHLSESGCEEYTYLLKKAVYKLK